jgi:hypothetical protein
VPVFGYKRSSEASIGENDDELRRGLLCDSHSRACNRFELGQERHMHLGLFPGPMKACTCIRVLPKPVKNSVNSVSS